MAQEKKAFVLGPGFVGREVIDLLQGKGYSISTIVRRPEAIEDFTKDGVKAVLGDLNDAKLIADLASQSDVVFHTATADHLASAEAILEGIRQRVKEGKETVYLHQSGASVLSDSSSDAASKEVYSDADPQKIDTLADNAPHRLIDLAILKARKEFGSKAKIFIMMPPIIYGSNPKYGRLSIQVPTLTRFALKHKYAGYAGKGQARWGVVHVLDLARAYMIILDAALDNSPKLDLSNPYFFCESGEVSWYDISAGIGKALHANGKLDSAEPKEVPSSEYADLFGQFTPDVVGCNSRNTADRLRTLGWVPKELSVFDAYEKEELPILLKETGFAKSALTLS